MFSKDDVGNIPGKPPLTDAEKQAIADEWNANEAAAPLEDWQRQMAQSDAVLPRWAEDIIDALEPAAAARLSAETKARAANKKTLRGQRPE